jgi:hypothetical protein
VARRISWRSEVLLLGSATLLCGPCPAPAGALPDRLAGVRELVRTRRGAGEGGAAVYHDIYELLDGEVVENLASGGVFASEGFLRDRLRAFADVWGGADIDLVKAADVVVGAFRLAGAPEGASVRVYGRSRGEPTLLAAVHRDGTPSLHAMRSGPGGAPQLVVVWAGEPSPRGSVPLRAELVRVDRDSLRVVWSTVPMLGGEVHARRWAVRPQEISVRYELRYPGWVPGCDGQSEQEDLFRYSAERHTFALARRQLHRPWHRKLRATVERLFAALRDTDERTLSELVPDPRVRGRLPAALEPEAACDYGEGASPVVVSVAAVLPDARQPWALSFRRGASGWRLVGAAPVHE